MWCGVIGWRRGGLSNDDSGYRQGSSVLKQGGRAAVDDSIPAVGRNTIDRILAQNS